MEKQTKAEKKQVTEEYRFLAVFSKEILDSEERREQAIIDQAGRMQQAFSFVTVAVLAIVPLLLSWTKLSQEYILVFSSIVLTGLCLSLMLATIAQWRYKREDYPNIADLHEKMKKEFRSFETEEQRDKYYVETLAVIQKSLGERTDKRIRHLKGSMLVFILTLFICVICFVIGLIVTL